MNNNNKRFHIRHACPHDCEQIVQLMLMKKKLDNNIKSNHQENLSTCQSNIVEQFKIYAFSGTGGGNGGGPQRSNNQSPSSKFRILVTELMSNSDINNNRIIIGYSIYMEKYSTWKGRILWIEDLSVMNLDDYDCDHHWQKYIFEAMLRKIASIAATTITSPSSSVASMMERIEWSGFLRSDQSQSRFLTLNNYFDNYYHSKFLTTIKVNSNKNNERIEVQNLTQEEQWNLYRLNL